MYISLLNKFTRNNVNLIILLLSLSNESCYYFFKMRRAADPIRLKFTGLYHFFMYTLLTTFDVFE